MVSRHNITLAALSLLLVACAGPQTYQCPPGTQNLPDCPPANAVNDDDINKLYASRTWKPQRKLDIDPIEMGANAQIPVNKARTKILGPSQDEALKSLAAKLWLIENAEHTVDVMYYIFKRDTVGYAMLGALCNAVKRGVDVRIMVDSLGSIHPSHSELSALETCAEDAGFIRNESGQITTKKARVQVVIFNALSNLNFNRRSHDKLLIVDGHHPDEFAVMTGGRNISLDYYGINADGSPDPTAFRDVEILIRANPRAKKEDITIGSGSEIYYTLLFLHKGNKRLEPVEDDEEDIRPHSELYLKEQQKSQDSLAFLKGHPEIKKRMQAMPDYMSKGFRESKVRLAHQLNNLTSTEVTTKVRENLVRNPNSILYIMHKLLDEAERTGQAPGRLRIVSPYLFSGKYYDEAGKVIYDGAKETLEFLRNNPEVRIEIITNSVMTSDNFFTQAVIDMDMAPRYLLPPEMREIWQSSMEKSEFNPDVVESEEWKKLINHPQIFIYQTGKLDSVYLGGKTHYGKLHAKYIMGDKLAFVGTSNFDYRSNLYNNEMGFFVQNPQIIQDLNEVFEWLKATSYRWGSPEWLQMRKELMASDTKKASPARKQRGLYKTMKGLGIIYLF
jgi:phosphatidylserine/phosphatidylglycerophosphate/cardiolipin synthase-like enzyme